MTTDAIERELAEIEAGREESSPGRVLDAMEEWIAQPGGAHALVERFAGSSSAVVAGTVAGVLARCTSWRRLGATSGPLVFRAIELLRVNHPHVRAALLTALVYSSMYRELVPDGEPPPQRLIDFLLDCASCEDELQLSALTDAIATLHADGTLARAPQPIDIETLRACIRAIKPAPDSLLEQGLVELEPFLSAHSPRR